MTEAGASDDGTPKKKRKSKGADGKPNENPEGKGNQAANRAFGEANRARLIGEYFQARPETGNAWEDVYRLLLWVDSKTGLAHCYESDKSQPGKGWYGKSLAFHDWLSRQFRVEPLDLGEQLDFLFRRATDDLAEQLLRTAQQRLERAAKQRRPYADRAMPTPGEDPVLAKIIRDALGDHLTGEVPRETWKAVIEKVREYLGLENKRKNILGEGFEDVIGTLVRRQLGASIDVRERPLLYELPGFNRVREGEKENKVDVALLHRDGRRRTLITAKWSIRADREKQFPHDLTDYVTARADSKPFDYVLVTNEFDPARLMRACGNLATNDYMFAYVVHINTDALAATYGDSTEESVMKVHDYIKEGRLIGFDRWLEKLRS